MKKGVWHLAISGCHTYKRKIIMKEKPFIHCFRTYNCCYFYDFNTNAIVRIPESVYVHLQHLEKGTANISECDADVNEILNRLTEQGFLSSHHWCKIEHPASKVARKLFRRISPVIDVASYATM